MLIRTETASGKRAMLMGGAGLELGGEPDEITHVRVEAYIEDKEGNRISLGQTQFTLDPGTVYVSAVSGTAGGDGSRQRPLSTLDAALVLAERLGSHVIYLSGGVRLTGETVLGGGLRLRGSYDTDWEKTGPLTIALEEGASIRVRGGALTLEGVNLERRGVSGPVFHIETGGELTLRELTLVHNGMFALLDEGAVLVVEDSSVFSFNAAAPRREALVKSVNSRVSFRGSAFSLEGNYGLMLEMDGGSLGITDSSFSALCLKTGTVLSLSGVRSAFQGAAFSAEAGDFASILESKNSPFVIQNSTFRAGARDAVLVSLEQGMPASDDTFLFLDSVFTVESSFVARAIEVRGFFPSVSGCSFIYAGTGRNSEIFSPVPEPRLAARLPRPGFIGGNSFIAFHYIMGREYPLESLPAFNRIFAPQGRDNV
ncbi:MAG: hypothetical protein LBK64_02495, partial [Spirochaetaceae bacterium]|nr:hypothetical protein [Spirochaetaceae bacterium]